MMERLQAPRRRPLHRIPVVVVSLAFLGLVLLLTLAAPLLAPADPMGVDERRGLAPPGPGNLLGTDFLGRDIWSRLLWGGQRTLAMGVLGLALTVGLGLPVGLTAGYLGGWVDTVLMRAVDALLAFPGLLLALGVVAMLGRGTGSVAVAVGVASAPVYARLARGAAMEVRTATFVEAARALGATQGRILLRHILPNAAGTLLAFATTQFGWVLLNAVALSFLGLGPSPGVPEWGVMLAESRGYLRDAPWASGFPGLALTLTVLAANLLGDGLQEALGGG